MARNGTDDREEIDDPLTQKQRLALPVLLAAPSVTAAAQQLGISRRTLCRWLTDKVFRAELRATEAELTDHGTRRLIGLQSKAIDALESVIDSADSPALKLRAAQLVLDYQMKLQEHRDILTRLDDLERQVQNEPYAGYGYR